jgi:hypothetical protein
MQRDEKCKIPVLKRKGGSKNEKNYHTFSIVFFTIELTEFEEIQANYL